MVMIATVTASFVTAGGRSAWFVGVLLLAVYVIFAATLYFMPPGSDSRGEVQRRPRGRPARITEVWIYVGHQGGQKWCVESGREVFRDSLRLIMTLSFTGTMSVVSGGRQEVGTTLISVVGCNIAWGVIDAILYLIGAASDAGAGLRFVNSSGGVGTSRNHGRPSRRHSPHSSRRRFAGGGGVHPLRI